MPLFLSIKMAREKRSDTILHTSLNPASCLIDIRLRERNLVSHPVSDSEVQEDSNLDSDAESDVYSDSDTDATDLFDAEVDNKNLLGASSEQVAQDHHDNPLSNTPGTELNKILNDISALREEGPAKPVHKPRTTKLWKRESEFWKTWDHHIVIIPPLSNKSRFAAIMHPQTRASATDLLKRAEPEILKAYLIWRKKNSRMKRQDSIVSYWKRLCMYYKDETGFFVDSNVTRDVIAVSHKRSMLLHSSC